MNFDKRKYTYIAIVVIIAVATVYVTYSLIKDGSPTVKSQNEYLVEANRLHIDSLYEEAVEPYMKAGSFDKQKSLVNYNTATNSIMKNYIPLSKSFNEEGYKLDASIDSALVYAAAMLDKAADGLEDTARYSSVYHNIGVASHMRNNLDVAAEAYKEALRKNPADEDARYNLAVILHQKKNEQQQQQNQDQQQEKEEQQQDKQEEKKEQEEKQQEQKEKEQENGQQEQQEQQDQQEQELKEDKEKIEQMLKALMQDEKEIREKMEEAEKVKVNSNSIEKNW